MTDLINDDVPAVPNRKMTIGDLLQRWPLRTYPTGGGCDAYRIDVADITREDREHDPRYFLLTESQDDGGDGLSRPERVAAKATVGLYGDASIDVDDDESDWATADLWASQIDAMFRAIRDGRDAYWVTESRQLVPRTIPITEAVAATPPMSIAEYFRLTFGRAPAAPSLAKFPIDKQVGRDSRLAIDAGFALIESVRGASGGDAKVERDIAAIVEAVINIYAFG